MPKFASALIAGILIAAPAFAVPQKYVFEPNHTSVTWHANHFGFSNPSGKFTDIKGTLMLDEEQPESSSLDVSIETASINTGLPKFDEHLKSDDFFKAIKFPEATFKSTKVEVTGKDTAKVYGDLTLIGVTQPVVLDVKLNKIGTGMVTQKKTAGFSATTTLQRSYFGMNYAIPGVADIIPIEIEVEAQLADDK